MITKQQYLDGEYSHREYYGEIVKELGYDKSIFDTFEGVVTPWEVFVALSTGDEHLNNIPRLADETFSANCDAQRGRFTSRYGLLCCPELSWAMKERGDGVSASTLVCVGKEAMRMFVENVHIVNVGGIDVCIERSMKTAFMRDGIESVVLYPHNMYTKCECDCEYDKMYGLSGDKKETIPENSCVSVSSVYRNMYGVVFRCYYNEECYHINASKLTLNTQHNEENV